MQVLVLFILYVHYKEMKNVHFFRNVNINKGHTAWSVLSKFGITVVKVILFLHCVFVFLKESNEVFFILHYFLGILIPLYIYIYMACVLYKRGFLLL